MIERKVVFTLLLALALGACSDASPTGPEVRPDEAAFELVAENALEVNDQQGTPLPSLHNLLRRTYKAIRENDGHGEGVRLLRAGKTLKGIIVVLGPEVADEALAGVDQALGKLAERFAGKTLPDRMAKIYSRAQELAGRGHEAMAAGNPVGALGAALASADMIRSLSPRFQARKAIDRATKALKAAREAVGDAPTDDEKTALRKALRFRDGAVEAFKAKAYGKAWNRALASMGFSHEVLKGRSGG